MLWKKAHWLVVVLGIVALSLSSYGGERGTRRQGEKKERGEKAAQRETKERAKERAEKAREARGEKLAEKEAKEKGTLRSWKTWDPGVNARQRNQMFRIAQGIKSGSLTKEEVQTLLQKEMEIAKLERELKSDGKLTIEERKQLHQCLNEASRMIFAEKHDAESRPKLNQRLVQKIESGEITPQEAKELYAQIRRLHELKRKLGGSSALSAEERAALEQEFNMLVANLHEAP